MTKNIVTDADLATFTKRSHELYRRFTEGTLPAGIVLAGLQALIEGQATVRTLAEMIKAGRYDWVNDDITEKKFPVDPARFTTDGVEAVHFGQSMSTEAVLAELNRRDLRPATIEELLAYGAANPEKQRKYPIVALGSSCVGRGGSRCSPCLSRGGGGRGLELYWLGSDWFEFYRFLAVRKSST